MQGDSSAQTPQNLDALAPDALRFHEVMEALYRKPDTHPGSIDPETGRFLYSFARLVQPELAVEVGTHHGISTLWMARALEDNGKGRLLALDLFENPPMDEVRETIERAGLAGRVELVRGPSATTGAQACRSEGRPIDLLFIDGDHRVEGCAADFETLGAMVKNGGFVILHDIYPERCGWEGPRYVLDLLAGYDAQTCGWQALELPPTANAPFGLALLQKCREKRTRILPRAAPWLYRWQTAFRFWRRDKRGKDENER